MPAPIERPATHPARGGGSSPGVPFQWDPILGLSSQPRLTMGFDDLDEISGWAPRTPHARPGSRKLQSKLAGSISIAWQSGAMRDEIRELECPSCAGALTVIDHPIMVDQLAEPVRWTVVRAMCTGTGRGCALTEAQIPEREA